MIAEDLTLTECIVPGGVTVFYLTGVLIKSFSVTSPQNYSISMTMLYCAMEIFILFSNYIELVRPSGFTGIYVSVLVHSCSQDRPYAFSYFPRRIEYRITARASF